MNKFEQQAKPVDGLQPSAAQAPLTLASPSRRRLVRLGTAVVPVVATLASRPALAWHCQSPSAWGSEQINPNTSLKTNAGHQRYPDETWYITNWRDNVARSDTGTTLVPWEKLKSVYPSIYDSTTKTSKKFDYTKVTIAKLVAVIPSIKVAGASGSALVKTVLTSGTDLQKSTIVAQLNYLLLSPYAANEIEECLAFSDLQKMADLTYQPSGQSLWSASTIKTYLYNNYIAR